MPGQRFVFLVPSFAGDSAPSADEILPGAGNAEVLPLPARRLVKNFFSDVYYGLHALPRALSTLQPDLFVSPYYDMRLPRVCRGKAVITVHDMCFWDLPGHYPWPMRKFHDHVLRHNLPLAAKVLTVSEFGKGRLLDHMKGRIAADRTVMIANSFDPADWIAPEKAPETSFVQRVQQMDGEFLLYAGGIERRKNIPMLLKATAVLHKKRPGLRLLITGDTRHIAPLTAMIEEHGLQDVAIRTGPLSHEEMVWSAVKKCSAAVSVSLYEGFGRPCLEAQACGLPLVCSDIPAHREAVGDYALYCDPNDVDSIVRAMAAALDMHRQEPMQADALRYTDSRHTDSRHTDSRYDVEGNAARFIEVLQEALHGT